MGESSSETNRHRPPSRRISNRTIKGFRGINPHLVSDLASELICGTKNAGDVAAALFDLVEGTDWAKEESHPMITLDSVEGVLDVTLDRVKALEEKQAEVGKGGDKGLPSGTQREVNIIHPRAPDLYPQFTVDGDDLGVGFDSGEYDEEQSGEQQSDEDKDGGVKLEQGSQPLEKRLKPSSRILMRPKKVKSRYNSARSVFGRQFWIMAPNCRRRGNFVRRGTTLKAGTFLDIMGSIPRMGLWVRLVRGQWRYWSVPRTGGKNRD